MSEDKKKMYYYYSGKEKKAGEIKKPEGAISPYQRDFDRMMERFQHDFDDFWSMPPRMRRWMRERSGFPMMPSRMMLSVDIEDKETDFKVTADLPGFSKEEINIEVGEDAVLIHARKMQEEEEKNKNFVRRERTSQTYYRRVQLPEKVKSDDAKASLNNGILEIVLPKKEPKETKKLKIT